MCYENIGADLPKEYPFNVYILNKDSRVDPEFYQLNMLVFPSGQKHANTIAHSLSEASRKTRVSLSIFLSPNATPTCFTMSQAGRIAIAHNPKLRYTLPTAAIIFTLLRPYCKELVHRM
jgi:hypothetical protein